MNEEQSAGELMALALIDQADRLGKSAWATQQELGKQIEKSNSNLLDQLAGKRREQSSPALLLQQSPFCPFSEATPF